MPLQNTRVISFIIHNILIYIYIFIQIIIICDIRTTDDDEKPSIEDQETRCVSYKALTVFFFVFGRKRRKQTVIYQCKKL